MEKLTNKRPQVPALQDLFADAELAFKNDSLKLLQNKAPKPEWVKGHPMAKGVKYLPIDKIEFLLDMIFKEWRIEVLSIQQIVHSIVVTVRIHYKANFVMIEVGMDVKPLIEAFRARKILVGRRFAPMPTWLRVSIGRPADTDAFLSALREIVPARKAA